MAYRKYKNKLVWLHKNGSMVSEIKPSDITNWIKFDSKLELATYQQLPKETTHLQVSIPLKLKTPNTPAVAYVADFATTINGKIYLIEAKGILTPESKLKLNLLDMIYPELFNNLIMVCANQKSISKLPKWLQGKAITTGKLSTLIKSIGVKQ